MLHLTALNRSSNLNCLVAVTLIVLYARRLDRLSLCYLRFLGRFWRHYSTSLRSQTCAAFCFWRHCSTIPRPPLFAVLNQTGNAILRFYKAKTRRKNRFRKNSFHVEISISLRIDLANKQKICLMHFNKSVVAMEFKNAAIIWLYLSGIRFWKSQNIYFFSS